MRHPLLIHDFLSSAGIAAAIKASYLPTLTANSDVTWITVNLWIWNATEVNVIIYAACLPAMRPLLLNAVEKMSTYTTRKWSLLGESKDGNGDQGRKFEVFASWPVDATFGFREDSELNRDSHELYILPPRTYRGLYRDI